MIEIHQKVETPLGPGVVIATSGDQVRVKYDTDTVCWEYRVDVKPERKATDGQKKRVRPQGRH